MEDEFDVSDEFIQKYTQRLIDKHSNIREYTNEAEIMALTADRAMVVHFYSPAFKKCSRMNEALRDVAGKFPGILFCLANIQNCPEMCTSLGVRVLPFLAFFKDGFYIDHAVGFEKFGNSDSFKTERLHKYIAENEICKEGVIRETPVR